MYYQVLWVHLVLSQVNNFIKPRHAKYTQIYIFYMNHNLISPKDKDINMEFIYHRFYKNISSWKLSWHCTNMGASMAWLYTNVELVQLYTNMEAKLTLHKCAITSGF
jgi:hypothetical protein